MMAVWGILFVMVSAEMAEIVKLEVNNSATREIGYYAIGNTRVTDEGWVAPIIAYNIRPTFKTGSVVLAHQPNITFSLKTEITFPIKGHTGFLPAMIRGWVQFNPYYGSGSHVTWLQINTTVWHFRFLPVELGKQSIARICTNHCLW